MIDKIKNYIKQGRNLFITGAGGTGKTYLLSKIIEDNVNEFIITASTGVACTNISDRAVTFSKFSGIGVTNCDNVLIGNDYDFLKLTIPDSARESISFCRRLIIEEVSILSAGILDTVDKLFRDIRLIDQPFGGIQVIILGDFLQLEPVITSKDVKDVYAFKSKAWNELNLVNIYLKEIKRTNDLFFAEILHRIRVGKFNKMDLDVIRATENHVLKNPLKLCGTNYEVNTINDLALKNCSGKETILKGIINGDYEDVKEIISTLRTPYSLTLKVGCRVMITVNERKHDNKINDIDNSLNYVNGTMGIFLGMAERLTKKKFVKKIKMANGKFIASNDKEDKEQIAYQVALIKLNNGEILELKRYRWDHPHYEETYFSQYPLMLAESVTVHKSQGLSLDEVEIDCKKISQPNQFYVAISRARSLEGLRVKNFSPSCIVTSKEAVLFYESLEQEIA